MYFTINMAFANYLDMFPNLTDSLQLITDKTTYEQPLPVDLSIPDFDRSLLHAPTTWKMCTIMLRIKENFDLKERHVSAVESSTYSNKTFFWNNYIVDIFMFTSSVISLITTTLIIYLLCKHKHIRTLVTSLILHKIK